MNRYSIIEVSDICIRAYEDGRQVYAEPGVALLPPNSPPVLGQQAQKVIRQQPTRIHSRFWSDLSTTPLSITQTSMRHGADLIWYQLAQIKESITTDEVVFCLSSHLNNTQMQLLAGICASLELKANYFLNIGLSQLAHKEKLSESIAHLDLQLHQLVLSRFTNRDGQLELASQEAVPGVSYLQLIDRMVHALRDQFIHVSRFDPLHSGDTEQQLFDQVAELIVSSQLKAIEIKTANQTYRIEPTPKDFEHVIAILGEALEKLVPTDEQRVLSPVFSNLPGFRNSAITDINLDVEDCIRGVEKLIARQESPVDGILYVSSILLAEPANTEAQAVDVEAKENHTEDLANALMFQGKVYPATRINVLLKLINAPESALRANGKGIFAGPGTQVNGNKNKDDQPFAINDEILLNQAHIMAVRLLE
ncbi:MAG: hypothetical protein RLN96_00270 [Pseudomonadales bacterium]